MRKNGKSRRRAEPVTRAEFLRALREMREDFAQRFAGVDQRFEALRDWVGLVVGRLQTRAGRNLENVVAGALRLALSMYDIQPEQVKLRQKMVDAEGRIGLPGRPYEFDILARDGETYVFEVKSTPEVEDLERFNDKAELAVSLLRPARWKKVLVTLDKDPEVLRRAEALGVMVV